MDNTDCFRERSATSRSLSSPFSLKTSPHQNNKIHSPEVNSLQISRSWWRETNIWLLFSPSACIHDASTHKSQRRQKTRLARENLCPASAQTNSKWKHEHSAVTSVCLTFPPCSQLYHMLPQLHVQLTFGTLEMGVRSEVSVHIKKMSSALVRLFFSLLLEARLRKGPLMKLTVLY